MARTPKGLRLHIGLFGRRNVGKSSLLNRITRQSISIVSDTAGTTTDPVEKPMELLPLGPVLFIDTAGIDDTGELGELRVKKTAKALERTDLGLIVSDGSWGEFEESILSDMNELQIPVAVVFNKADLGAPDSSILSMLDEKKVPVLQTCANKDTSTTELRSFLLANAPSEFIENPVIAADLVPPGKTAVLVVPIDKEAPKGRLINPQVQTIRDLLDHDAITMVVKERELRAGLDQLKSPPALVITDSQAFLKVAADTPLDVPITSFSVLFARFKGDLTLQTEGAMAIESLGKNAKILIAESCSHHPIGEDIGRVKIPRWLTQYTGKKLHFDVVQGRDFPESEETLASYDLVIHCGGCMWNRRQMLSRLMLCKRAGVPITNYGLVIAYSLGIFERALKPFPAAYEVYKQNLKGKSC
jgi:[FeFe] hydrogenase H-cluster maturation GTPase HydF